MEKTFEFTRTELIEAFSVYNANYLENPDVFEEKITDAKSDAERQVDYVLEILEKIKAEKVA